MFIERAEIQQSIYREDNCMKNDQNNGQIIIKIDSPMAWKKLLHFYRLFFYFAVLFFD